MQLKDINGYYVPSFFNIVLETDEDVSLALEKYTQTFEHEFIHYLQDLLLPYNIRMNFTKLALFLDIREFAMTNDCIERPFINWNNNSEILNSQYNYTIGKNCNNVQFFNDVQKIDCVETIASELIETQGRKFTLYKYNVSINNKSITYNLGARDLLEYIAYKIESKHYPTNLPQFPYKSIDLLFEYYDLSHISEDIRLCIAEFCLYNDNPIRMLMIHFLENEEFKQYSGTFTYEIIYKKLLAFEFETTNGSKELISDKFDRRINEFAQILTNNYIQLSEIKKWIFKVNDFVTSELSGKFIFSDIHRMDINEYKAFIGSTIHRIGIPLVMNNKKKCISLQSQKVDNSQFIHFYTLQQFINFIFSEPMDRVCPIYDFCEANNGKCDDSCISNPKSKISDHQNCPYIKFLKSYGLFNVEFI